jgi:hypothetical protein
VSLAALQLADMGEDLDEDRFVGSYPVGPDMGGADRERHPFEVAETLALRIRSRSTLHLSTHRTPINKKVFFSGELPGPSCAGRTAYVKATVRGASRKVLVRQATTDTLCHFRIGYAFSPIPRRTRFVVWVYVPEQAGYQYRPGRSVNRYIRVNPHPPKTTKHSSRR